MNVYVRELARELGARGVPVDIFTRSQDRSAPTVEPLSCGVRVVNLHTGPAVPYDKNWILTYLPEFVSRVRCFADGDVTHVEGSVDPERDIDTIETELMLADLDSLERRVTAAVKKARGGDREAKADLDIMEPVLALLREGRPARGFAPSAEQARRFAMLQLLTAKPVLYVCNVEESAAAEGNALSARVFARAAAEGAAAVVLCPIGFVCDHIEVLYDLDHDALNVAREIGLPIARASAVNDDPIFLDMMAEVVLATIHRYDSGRPLPLGPLPARNP